MLVDLLHAVLPQPPACYREQATPALSRPTHETKRWRTWIFSHLLIHAYLFWTCQSGQRALSTDTYTGKSWRVWLRPFRQSPPNNMVETRSSQWVRVFNHAELGCCSAISRMQVGNASCKLSWRWNGKKCSQPGLIQLWRRRQSWNCIIDSSTPQTLKSPPYWWTVSQANMGLRTPRHHLKEFYRAETHTDVEFSQHGFGEQASESHRVNMPSNECYAMVGRNAAIPYTMVRRGLWTRSAESDPAWRSLLHSPRRPRQIPTSKPIWMVGTRQYEHGAQREIHWEVRRAHSGYTGMSAR